MHIFSWLLFLGSTYTSMAATLPGNLLMKTNNASEQQEIGRVNSARIMEILERHQKIMTKLEEALKKGNDNDPSKLLEPITDGQQCSVPPTKTDYYLEADEEALEYALKISCLDNHEIPYEEDVELIEHVDQIVQNHGPSMVAELARAEREEQVHLGGHRGPMAQMLREFMEQHKEDQSNGNASSSESDRSSLSPILDRIFRDFALLKNFFELIESKMEPGPAKEELHKILADNTVTMPSELLQLAIKIWQQSLVETEGGTSLQQVQTTSQHDHVQDHVQSSGRKMNENKGTNPSADRHPPTSSNHIFNLVQRLGSQNAAVNSSPHDNDASASIHHQFPMRHCEHCDYDVPGGGHQWTFDDDNDAPVAADLPEFRREPDAYETHPRAYENGEGIHHSEVERERGTIFDDEHNTYEETARHEVGNDAHTRGLRAPCKEYEQEVLTEINRLLQQIRQRQTAAQSNRRGPGFRSIFSSDSTDSHNHPQPQWRRQRPLWRQRPWNAPDSSDTDSLDHPQRQWRRQRPWNDKRNLSLWIVANFAVAFGLMLFMALGSLSGYLLKNTPMPLIFVLVFAMFMELKRMPLVHDALDKLGLK